MNTYQKYYMAFMESVCKQFNCPEALPALTEGFKDLCEATAKDSFRPSRAPLGVMESAGDPAKWRCINKFNNTFVNMNLTGLTEENINKVLNNGNFSMDEKKTIMDMFTKDDSATTTTTTVPSDIKKNIQDYAKMNNVDVFEINDTVREFFRDRECREAPNADYMTDFASVHDTQTGNVNKKGKNLCRYMQALGFTVDWGTDKYGSPFLTFKFNPDKDPYLKCK